MKSPLSCETRFPTCSSRMLKLRAEVPLLLPPRKKLPRARLLTNRLLRNLPRQVKKGSRARNLRKATGLDRADYRPGRRGFHAHYARELVGRDSVEIWDVWVGLNSLMSSQSG